MGAFVTAVTAVAVLASTATAARISSSPWIFDRADVHRAAPMIRGAISERFASSATTTASCRGAYPGTHGGVAGFHEIHCAFTVTWLSELTKRGEAVYWIDAKRRTRLTIHWR